MIRRGNGIVVRFQSFVESPWLEIVSHGWVAGPSHNPNLEDQVIRFRGLLLLAFTDPSVNRKATVLVLVCSGYFISPVPFISGERSPIRHMERHPMGDQYMYKVMYKECQTPEQ
jgi:hypothetical protein